MEPMGAHRFAPVSRNIDDAAIAIGHTCPWISGILIDGIVSGKDHRPAIIVILTREEE